MNTISIIFTGIFTFIGQEGPLFTAIAIGFCIEFVSRSIKKRMKTSIFAKYDNSTDPKHAEYYLSYYRKIQIIDIIRAISVLLIIFTILTFKTGNSINFLAVGLGAIIVILKDFWLSIIAFFFIVRQYKIGDTLAIDTLQGQLIYIRIFSVGIIGKDNDGDNTGKLYVIPTYKFITDIIRKEDLHVSSIRKEILRIPFQTEKFSISFSIFLDELKKLLEETLPIMQRKNAGNYQTYIGHKYKMDMDYLDEKCIIISIGMVGKWENNVKNKETIIKFVESKKYPHLQEIGELRKNIQPHSEI